MTNPFEAPQSPESPPQPEETPPLMDGPQGLGGWLVLPLLGLVFSIGQRLISLGRDYYPMFQPGGDWSIVVDPGLENYHPAWAPLIAFEILTSVGFIIFSVYLLFLALGRSRRFPKLMIAFYLANAIVVLVDLAWAQMIPALASPLSALTADFENVRSIFIPLLWCVYFQRSRRVRNTFVEA